VKHGGGRVCDLKGVVNACEFLNRVGGEFGKSRSVTPRVYAPCDWCFHVLGGRGFTPPLCMRLCRRCIGECGGDADVIEARGRRVLFPSGSCITRAPVGHANRAPAQKGRARPDAQPTEDNTARVSGRADDESLQKRGGGNERVERSEGWNVRRQSLR